MATTALSLDFLKAYARLPRKAQRKADAFVEKFRENPRAPAIHLERIQEATDEQLRSVRIGDDYRAVLRAPEKGDVFVLLWVDHHDEAYRWARAKRTEIHPATGTLQIFDVEAAEAAAAQAVHEPDTSESVHESAPPGLFAAYDDEQLFVGGVPRVLLPAVRAVGTEADLDRLLPHLPDEAGEVLTGLAAGLPFDDVLAEVLDRAAPPSEPPPAVDTADLARALERSTSQRRFRVIDADFDLEAALRHPLDVWRVFLHPRQRTIAEARTKGPTRVLGAAGTGKTVVALHRTAFLVRQVWNAPDDRVLLTTFTRNLASDLRTQLAKLLNEDELRRVEIINLDAWAARFLSSTGAQLRLASDEDQRKAWDRAIDLYGVDGVSAEFYIAEWRDVVQEQDIRDIEAYVRCTRRHRGTRLSRPRRRALWPVFERYRTELEERGMAEAVEILRQARLRLERSPELSSYRSVVVDEAQDFSTEGLRLLRALAGSEHPDDLFLVGDAHQRIYGRPVSLSGCGINVRGRRSRTLRINYRTTAAISRWSLTTLRGEQFDDLDDGRAETAGYVSLREGSAPEVRHFRDSIDEHRFIVEEVQRLLADGAKPEEICITARTHSQLRSAYGPSLEAAGIDYEEIAQEEPSSSRVRLATMHRIKGLEFPVVFVAGVNEGLVPYRTPELTTDDPVVARLALLRERCLLYVASSRARDALYVTSYGRRSRFLDIAATAAPDAPAAPPPSVRSPPPSARPAPDRDALLDAPVDTWPLPTRVLSWAERKEVRTIRDLAVWTPSALSRQKNLGRTSIAELRSLLEQRFGESWEALRAALVPEPEPEAAPVADPNRVPHWNELRTWLKPSLMDSELSLVELPTRMRNHCERHALRTVRDLVSLSARSLIDADNLGRTSVTDSRDAIVAFANQTGSEEEDFELGFLASFKAELAPLDPVRRMVFTLRSGLSGRSETLASIGEMLGVSRERARQIESDAIARLKRRTRWLAYVSERLRAAMVGDAVPLAELAKDEWWTGLDSYPDALDYFLERVLASGQRIVAEGDDRFVAAVDQTVLDDEWNQARARVAALTFPVPEAQLRSAWAPIRERIGATMADALYDRLEEELTFGQGDDGQRTVLAFGDTKASLVLAYLRAAPEPVSIHEIYERFGRLRFPDEVLFFRRGVVGLEQHFPDFQAWKERLAPEAVAVMEHQGPTRQWSVPALHEELAEKLDLPDWLGHWHLASVLRRSDRVVYLGRLRVALPGAAEPGGRILVRDALQRALDEHGSPLARSELFARVQSQAGAAETTLSMTALQPPFVTIDSERIGLVQRDLPGGAEAIASTTDEIERELTQRGVGLTTHQLAALLAGMSGPAREWSPEMAISVVRSDPRFRLSISGNVGLAEWETVRVPSRKQILVECLREGGGRAKINAVAARIHELYGTEPNRAALGQLGNSVHARISDDEVVLDGD